MQELISFLEGKKTYIISICTVLFGILGWALGYIPQDQAVELILVGLGFGSLRAGVSKPFIKSKE